MWMSFLISYPLTVMFLLGPVDTNTHKTALNSLAFLYNQFLKKPLGNFAFKHSNKEQRAPMVFLKKRPKLY